VAEATHESATTLRISGACEPTRAKFGPQGRIDLQGCVGSGAGAGGLCGGRSRSLGARSFPSGCPTSVTLAMPLRFQLPPVEPCMRFSRTRLTDVVHRRHSVSPARPERAGERRRVRQGRSGRGGAVIGRKPPNDHSRGCAGVVC